ncbi:hypothetical protein LOC67_17170 [Stieleria sp. JC731]|uniref:hypothetical protein n=1 Tax=Pirellulaceae TaxID=2691357 RepID=UPI001E5B7969|nr:hypothetical protein [Stieleria sp. JC731]MCC9602288.1 hypothetical protein [Stieleria sp. JC731]
MNVEVEMVAAKRSCSMVKLGSLPPFFIVLVEFAARSVGVIDIVCSLFKAVQYAAQQFATYSIEDTGQLRDISPKHIAMRLASMVDQRIVPGISREMP